MWKETLVTESGNNALVSQLEQKGVLLGCAVDSGTPQFVEIAGRLGYDIIWIDLEHYSRDASSLQTFCTNCEATGALSLMRIADASRTSILHALELGTRLIVIPMVNDAATAFEIVQHGKFAPLGNRGFNGGTRAMAYGMEDRATTMAAANRDTHLFPQIETAEGFDHIEEIVGVDGISGGLVGPADLSISLGMPLEFENPKFVECYRQAIARIRACGKIAATATGHTGLLRTALEAGVQIIIGASELGAIRDSLRSMHIDLCKLVRETAGPNQEAHSGMRNSL